MKRFSEQFKKQSENIALRDGERTALRERLVSYMEYHPLPASMTNVPNVSKTKELIPSEPFSVLKFSPLYVRSFAGLFAMVVLVSVPFVAEHAVPGDVLYPVKVQFNEELRSSLSLSPYAKVAWETQRLERRLAEARLLASEGKLTEEAETQVAQAVKDHTDAAQREIAQLRESDSDGAAIAEITFASALAVQTEVLENHIENDQSGNGGSVVALAQVVAEARDSAEAAQNGSLPSYDKLLGRVESESTHVYELFASVKRDATPEETQDVERRIADIERKIAQANAMKNGTLATDDVVSSTARTMAMKVPSVSDVAPIEEASTTATDTVLMMTATLSADTDTVATQTPETVADDAQQRESVAILRSALADIQKLLSYMTHLDVRRNVSLNELVPLTQTPEEQTDAIMNQLNETLELQERITSREVDEKKSEKVAAGLQELELKISDAVTAMQGGDTAGAQKLIEEAHTLAVDLDHITERDPQKPVVELKDDVNATTTPEETLQ